MSILDEKNGLVEVGAVVENFVNQLANVQTLDQRAIVVDNQLVEKVEDRDEIIRVHDYLLI